MRCTLGSLLRSCNVNFVCSMLLTFLSITVQNICLTVKMSQDIHFKFFFSLLYKVQKCFKNFIANSSNEIQRMSLASKVLKLVKLQLRFCHHFVATSLPLTVALISLKGGWGAPSPPFGCIGGNFMLILGNNWDKSNVPQHI